MLFDAGLLWAQPAAPADAVRAVLLPWQFLPLSALVVQVYDPCKGSEHLQSVAGKRMSLPATEGMRQHFPTAPVWEWRCQWAALKRENRQQAADHLTRLMY